MPSTTHAVLLHAAGSLRGALTEVAAAFETSSGVKVVPKWGPSGLLRDQIANGEKAELFASANREHPDPLAKAGKSGPTGRLHSVARRPRHPGGAWICSLSTRKRTST
ncbi:MAG: substrate-binding domain-containing protein [Pseudorhodoplanes sp.]